MLVRNQSVFLRVFLQELLLIPYAVRRALQLVIAAQPFIQDRMLMFSSSRKSERFAAHEISGTSLHLPRDQPEDFILYGLAALRAKMHIDKEGGRANPLQ
jgi:hypothetical protein